MEAKESEDDFAAAAASTSGSTDNAKYTLFLHTYLPGETCPNIEPLALKVETYLRIAGIEYQRLSKYKQFGPKGKTPWITFNGEKLEDSALIIDFLNKTLKMDLWGNATKEEKAVSQAMRIMLEDHFLLELQFWRYVTEVQTKRNVFEASGVPIWRMKRFTPDRVKTRFASSVILLYTEEERMQIFRKDLVALADYLGDKPYFLGNEPTEIDSTIFGIMAQFVYASPGSPYEKIINEEYPNVKEYCERMKRNFWQDWDSMLRK